MQSYELVVRGQGRALVNYSRLPGFGNSEVTDFRLTDGIEQHISGLQISMKLLLVLVQVIQTLQELEHYVSYHELRNQGNDIT